jgi:hypothetical protein
LNWECHGVTYPNGICAWFGGILRKRPLTEELGRELPIQVMKKVKLLQVSRDDIERNKLEPAFPPNEWLKERFDASMIDSGRELPFAGSKIMAKTGDRTRSLDASKPVDRDWERIKIRMLPEDELWTFSSSADSWAQLAGRMGIALVRNGRAIKHAVTLMN